MMAGCVFATIFEIIDQPGRCVRAIFLIVIGLKSSYEY